MLIPVRAQEDELPIQLPEVSFSRGNSSLTRSLLTLFLTLVFSEKKYFITDFENFGDYLGNEFISEFRIERDFVTE